MLERDGKNPAKWYDTSMDHFAEGSLMHLNSKEFLTRAKSSVMRCVFQFLIACKSLIFNEYTDTFDPILSAEPMSWNTGVPYCHFPRFNDIYTFLLSQIWISLGLNLPRFLCSNSWVLSWGSELRRGEQILWSFCWRLHVHITKWFICKTCTRLLSPAVVGLKYIWHLMYWQWNDFNWTWVIQVSPLSG